MRKKIPSSTLSAPVFLPAAPVSAAPQSKLPSYAKQKTTAEQPNTEQIKLFRQAKVGLVEAIAAAKNQSCGKLMDVSFDVRGANLSTR